MTQVDDLGSHAAIVQMAARFEPDSILLFNEQGAYGHGEMLGTTLYFAHDLNVFTVHDHDTLDTAAFSNQLRRWEESGRAIYWVIPTGITTPFPLPGSDWQRTNPQAYSIEYTHLEEDYYEKPTEIKTVIWSGDSWSVKWRE